MNTIDELFATGKPNMNTPKPVETITLFHNRDAMHQQLMNKVRLNRYDMKFMVNIAEKYLGPGKPLSPGQNTLYEKIVHKYRKQLRKMKVNYKDVLALPWANGIVTPEILNQQTYFRIVNEEMQLYFNFNKKQIEDVRAIVHDDTGNHLNRGNSANFGNGQKYNFNWNNKLKTWAGPFNVYLFKQLYDFATSTRVRVDRSVIELANTMAEYGTTADWTPSLHEVNGRMYVSHITETMLPFLDKIDPADTSIENIERMTELGLQAPDEFSHIGEYVGGGTACHDITGPASIKVLQDYVEQSGRRIVFHVPELARNGRLNKVFDGLRDCTEWDGITKHFADPNNPILPIYSENTSSEELDNALASKYNTLITTAPLTSLLRSQQEIGKFALAADKVIYLSLNEPK